jgi:putative flippase GtrA
MDKFVRRNFLNTQFLKFIAIGALNTLFGYFVYIVFILAGIEYHLALTFATILGVIFNFFTTGKIVFLNKGLNNVKKFIILYFSIYCINQVLLTILVEHGVNMIISQTIIMPLLVLTSYLIHKHYIFFPNKN